MIVRGLVVRGAASESRLGRGGRGRRPGADDQGHASHLKG